MTSNLFGVMDEISGTLCAYIALLCLLGLRAESFKDNWLQTFGMGLTMLGAMVMSYWAFSEHRSSWRVALFVFGVALFATGVAVKIWKYRHQKQSLPPLAARHIR